MNYLSFLDGIIIALFLFITVYIAFINQKDREQTLSDYFLAGRNNGWFVIGASLFATNISSEHFIGLAGSGASRGLAVGQFEWFAIFIILILGWIFAPVFIKSNVYTIPEFLGKRYDNRTRNFLAIFSIGIYILTKISVTLFAGGLLLKAVLGWNLFTSSIVMVLIAGLYTIIGGMIAVVYTQVFHTIVIILGGLVLTITGMNEIGGFSQLVESLPKDFFHIFKPISDPDFPWLGMIIGAPIIAVWYWCTDQYIVQRILSARDVKEARKGSLLAAILKIFPVFILVLPGLVAKAIYPNLVGDEAYGYLITASFIPSGLRGLAIAGSIAALMSSLSSVFNSTSALFTMDFYRTKYPESTESKLLLIGRLATVGTVLLAILWIPLIKILSSNMYIYLQSVQSFLSPPIAAVFIFGILSGRVNSNGSYWTLLIGGSIGVLRSVIEIYKTSFIDVFPFLQGVLEINYLHFSIILFLFSTFVLFAGSKIGAETEVSEVKAKGFKELIPFYSISSKNPVVGNFNISRGEIYLSFFILISAIAFWSILF